MKYYIEITLIDNAEITPYQLWSKFYTQLHLAFVELKNTDGQIPLGVSFPQYQFNADKQIGCLGTKLRVFAIEQTTLQQLNLPKWLANLTDFLHITTVRPVPDQISYATYQRKQFKTNAETLARRRLKQYTDMDFAQAVKHYSIKLKQTHLPYIHLKSLTNKQLFRLFIEKKLVKQATSGAFGSYGLSAITTVPEF